MATNLHREAEDFIMESVVAAASSNNNSSTASLTPMTKGKKRIKKLTEHTALKEGPPSIVCTASSTHSNSVELGLLLSLAVLALYLFGCYESIRSLPEIPLTIPWELGSNLNVARNELGHDASPKSKPESHPQMRGLQTRKQVAAKTGQIVVPKPPKWPPNVMQEERHDFETIMHPGDNKTPMEVPKFWSRPVHNGGLMTRDTAMQIGSCITPDSQGNYNRGDDCPPEKRTIYLAIASYRDFECRSTLESAFLRASHPERIRVGVVDQIVEDEDPKCNAPIEPCEKNPNQALCLYKNQVDVFVMDAELSVGPVFARHLGHRLYRGEYYSTQNDAHITYVQGWDDGMISQMEATGNEMAVISTYLTDVQGSVTPEGKSLRNTRPIMCNTYYEGGQQGQHLRHGSQPERVPFIKDEPMLEPYWAAGYSFSRGHFIVNVPYDQYQPMIFQGEEMSIGIRGFTVGYDYYAPQRSVCFHHYAIGENAKKRSKVHHFWENSRNFEGTGRKAMTRLLGIVHMNPEKDPSTWDHTDEDLYGIGGVRTPETFYEVFGIDVVKKKTERHLCRFVDEGGKMHNQFKTKLRKDGMGIDYSLIDYKFTDPAPNEK